MWIALGIILAIVLLGGLASVDWKEANGTHGKEYKDEIPAWTGIILVMLPVALSGVVYFLITN